MQRKEINEYETKFLEPIRGNSKDEYGSEKIKRESQRKNCAVKR